MPDLLPEDPPPERGSLPLWKAIMLIILLVFALTALFGGLVYLFTSGAHQLGLPLIANLTVFVIISGIFAWLINRLADIVSGMSRLWFPEDTADIDDDL